MKNQEYITTDPCSDPAAILRAVATAKVAAEECMTAIVMLTSKCTTDGHGIHTSTAVLNKTGEMEKREAKAAVRRLRSLADELEQRFCG